MQPPFEITDFGDHVVRTFTYEGRSAWLVCEIERALERKEDEWVNRESMIHRVDCDAIEVTECCDLFELLKHDDVACGRLHRILFETGLALACAGLEVGNFVRRELLDTVAWRNRRETHERRLAAILDVPVSELWNEIHAARVRGSTRTRREGRHGGARRR